MYIIFTQRFAKLWDSIETRKYLISDEFENYSILSIPADHHDIHRVILYGLGQKVILENVEIEPDHAFQSKLELSVIQDIFQRGSLSVKCKIVFHKYSRIKLPLNELFHSKLNLSTGTKSEDYISPDPEKRNMRKPNTRVNI